tara:strand:+ start:13923 stop:14336 length:414 start_codon:yes stop_codon:yes gene_type:complete
MIVIIKSEFNKEIVDGLLKGCKRALGDKEIKIISVPGAFELPAAARSCLDINGLYSKYEAVITLGCVIKGETDHYDFICQAVSKGIMDVSIQSQVPILFGVLTCQNAELAFERSRDNDSNKGFEVGLAALELLNSDK